MPAPILRCYQHAPPNNSVWSSPMPALIAAGRALVISKITVCSLIGGNQKFSLAIAPTNTPTAAQYIVGGMVLGPGEVFTETGLVVLPGLAIYALTDVSMGIAVSVSGEEVDN